MRTQARWNITRFLITMLYLFLGWLLFTWSLAPTAIALGLLNAGIISLLTFPIFIEDSEAAKRSHFPRIYLLGVYLLVLVVNMYLASFKVLWQIIQGKINPGVVHFRTRLRSEIARVVLTNAITTTPGTITVMLNDDHLIVHWLDARTTHSKYAHKLIAAPFEKVLKRIWI
jgi:multicomponent Na+:H+ antiporter subunit E